MRPDRWLFAALLVTSNVAMGESGLFLKSTHCLRSHGPYGPQIALPVQQLVDVEVRALTGSGGDTFEFALPWFDASHLRVISVTPNPAALHAEGNPFAGGAKISFSTCQPAMTPVTLYTATLWSYGGPPVPWMVVSPTFPTGCATVSCAGGAPECLTALESEQTIAGPIRPVPLHGAIDVSPPVYLGYDWSRGCSCQGSVATSLWFGTDPDPPLFHSDIDGLPPRPDLGLAPNTTYYWRVGVSACEAASGPVWKFTTSDFIGVAPSSWSKTKRLYR